MKLKSAKNVGKPTEQRQKLNPKEIQKAYMEKREQELKDRGVVLFDVHEDNLNIDPDFLSLPREITEVPSRDLGQYLNAFTQQKMYLRTLLGRAELLLESARRAYYEVSEPFYTKYSAGKMSETAKERLINANEEVRPLYYLFLDRKRDCSLIEYAITNIEDAIFLISREVTRRTGDFNEENRNHNVSRR